MTLIRIIPKFWDDLAYWKQPFCSDMTFFGIKTDSMLSVFILLTSPLSLAKGNKIILILQDGVICGPLSIRAYYKNNPVLFLVYKSN